MMQVGDIVKHKNSPDRLRIRTLKNGICSCEFIDEPKIYHAGGDVEDFRRCVVKLENLLPYEEEKKPQLNLFE